jgi:hypothetical protein
MKMKVLFLSLNCLFFCCSNHQSGKLNNEQNKSNANDNVINTTITNKIKNMDSTKFKDALILTLEEALKKYGTPLKSEQFILNDALPEFRIELNNIYTKEQRMSGSIVIEEVTWQKDTLNNITVWYEKIKKNAFPKNSFIWNKSMEF